MRCKNETGKEVLVRTDGKDGLYIWKVVVPGTVLDLPYEYAKNLGFKTEQDGPIIEDSDDEPVKKEIKSVESAIGETKVETKMQKIEEEVKQEVQKVESGIKKGAKKLFGRKK